MGEDPPLPPRSCQNSVPELRGPRLPPDELIQSSSLIQVFLLDEVGVELPVPGTVEGRGDVQPLPVQAELDHLGPPRHLLPLGAGGGADVLLEGAGLGDSSTSPRPAVQAAMSIPRDAVEQNRKDLLPSLAATAQHAPWQSRHRPPPQHRSRRRWD